MDPTKEVNLGNQLNRIVCASMGMVFLQGELAQLTYSAFDHAAVTVRDGKEEWTLNYPVGYSPSKQPMLGSLKYKKAELIERYRFLANTQLAINGIYQLVTVVEAMLGDIVRAIILKYPHKLTTKRTLSMETVLKASSLEEIHLRAVESLLNDLSYKTPREFAEEVGELMSIKPLECPAFHEYIEIKASRDILIHNRGIANEVYVRKSGSHARVAAGQRLPVNEIYLLESYESCLQLVEWIEAQLHDVWHSSEYETRQQQKQST